MINIRECFEENAGAFTRSLQGAGFSVEQAGKFLPEAASGILESTKESGITQLSAGFASGDPAKPLSDINVDAIADKLGMDADQVSSGLLAIMPVLSSVMSDKSEGILDAVSSLAGGSTEDLINAAKKFFSLITFILIN